MATVLTQKQKDLRSISFGSEQAVRPHSLYREVADVRNDVEVAFKKIEQAELPFIVCADIGVQDNSPNIAAATDSNNDPSVCIRNFGVREHFASITIDNKIVVKHPGGTSANELTVEVLAGGGASASVDELGNLTLVTEAGSTIQDLINIINSYDGGSFFAFLADGANGGDASSTIANTTATKLGGGSGLGVSFSVTVFTDNNAKLEVLPLKIYSYMNQGVWGTDEELTVLFIKQKDSDSNPSIRQVASLTMKCHTSTSVVTLPVRG
jgi:hypothetical protein